MCLENIIQIDDETRFVEKFLLLPKTIKGKKLWLEKAIIVQKRKEILVYSKYTIDNLEFKQIWVDSEFYEEKDKESKEPELCSLINEESKEKLAKQILNQSSTINYLIELYNKEELKENSDKNRRKDILENIHKVSKELKIASYELKSL